MDNSFQQYFNAMPCYLTVQDRDFRIIQANERFIKHFGSINGRYCYQVYKQRSEKCEVCPVEQTFWDGESHRSEQHVTCLDGKEVVVVVDTTPIRDADGNITAVMEMSTDVTQINRLQTKLRTSQQRYRLLFEEVPCYISIQDPDLNIIESNRAFQDDFGNALGCKCFEAYKHRTEECVPCPVRQTFQDGLAHTREEVVTSIHGEQRNVLVTTTPIRDATGQIVAVMEMSANITEVRQLESQLTNLGLLIGSVSHGLKGLLNGLSGGMYLVDTGFKKENEERIAKGWEIVQRNVGRIRSMVSDILYYAKDRVPNWETLSARETFEEVGRLVAARAQEQGVRVELDLDGESGEFEADAQAVRSMLTNLTENALDACRLDRKRSDHCVTLRLRGMPDVVQFEIADNGIGMDRETREKAFSLFFSSKGMEGTGLGLFIANRIANAHGGSIKLESESGVGTTFSVKMPRKRPPPEDSQSATKETTNGG